MKSNLYKNFQEIFLGVNWDYSNDGDLHSGLGGGWVVGGSSFHWRECLFCIIFSSPWWWPANSVCSMIIAAPSYNQLSHPSKTISEAVIFHTSHSSRVMNTRPKARLDLNMFGPSKDFWRINMFGRTITRFLRDKASLAWPRCRSRSVPWVYFW